MDLPMVSSIYGIQIAGRTNSGGSEKATATDAIFITLQIGASF